MEKNTVVELGRNYGTRELKPFLHQQWIYISEKNEQGEIETKKIESPLAGTPKIEKGYQGFSHAKDLWYLKIPHENAQPRLCIRRFGLEDPSLFSKSRMTSVNDSVFKRASSITFIVSGSLGRKNKMKSKK